VILLIDIRELSDKISNLKLFKAQINDAIRDEQEAQRIYDKILPNADKADSRVKGYISPSYYFSEVRGIRDQEHTHESKFKMILDNVERTINELENMLRHKEDDDRKKRDEEQRRNAKLTEGYHGPYKLKRY
jgi:hypothetical protein